MRRREKQRYKMVVPVRVWRGSDPPELAHTLDATEDGARLGGLLAQVEVGEIIILQYQHRRARCVVVWADNTQKRQIGLRCLEPEKDIWGVPLPRGRSELLYSKFSVLKATVWA